MISVIYRRTGEILQVKLTWRRRLALALTGIAHVETRGPPEFTGDVPLYLARCKDHGFYVDFPHGHEEVLFCPVCRPREDLE